MDRIPTFKEFLATDSMNISVTQFSLTLLLGAVLASILSIFYVKFATSISCRKSFSRNFLLLTLTTILIISVIKSSLALSLGLVGALSIVRFRSAIKEPEEILYLFFAISIGLGLGAFQIPITLLSFVIILFAIFVWNKVTKQSVDTQNLHLLIQANKQKTDDCSKRIVEILEEYCNLVTFKRLEENNEYIEMDFIVSVSDFKRLNEMKQALGEEDNFVKVSIFDHKVIQ